MQTPIQELITKIKNLKTTSCSLLSEVLFFDGILAIIDSKKLLDKEKELITDAYLQGGIDILEDSSFQNVNFNSNAPNYYLETFDNQ